MSLLPGVTICMVAFGVVTFVYVLSIALLARSFGVVVEVVSVGFGPCIYEIQWHGIRWRLSLILFGGYTKMFGEDESTQSQSGSFLMITPLRRLLVILIGPVSNLLLGCLLVLPAFLVPGGSLTVNPQGMHPIVPSMVPHLNHAPSELETVASLVRLNRDTWGELFLRVLRWESLEGWGGYTAWCVTAAAILKQSFQAWLTCVGLLAIGNGLINLLPIPVLIGGHAMMLVWEVCFGKPSKIVVERLTWIGLLIALYLMARLCWADWVWLERWYNQGMPC